MKSSFKHGNSRHGERGVVLFLAISALVMAVPMVGLTVDVGFLYASKTRLQASVDGAALAAARALNLGETTDAQKLSAIRNATNWFYSNFPPGNWSTKSTTLDKMEVFDHPQNANLRVVEIEASTRVPTFFMKWFSINDTQIHSKGTANRRDAVVMMVLDRSSSMATTNACGALIEAAKLFTGQFAAGRDRIGMISFSDGISPVYPPTTSFRTTLGYTAGSASGNGALDNITCNGGTGTAAAISVAQRELDQINLPGALNILLLETDGLPNTLAFDFWDDTRNHPDKSPLKRLYTGGGAAGDTADEAIGCGDGQSSPKPRGWWTGSGASQRWGWGRDSDGKRLWSKPGPFAPSPNPTGFTPYISSGMIGAVYSTDPSRGKTFLGVASPWHTSQNMGVGNNSSGSSVGTVSNYGTSINAITNQTAAGCLFSGTDNADDLSDFNRLPRTDLFGNDVKPTNAYYTGSELRMVDSDLNYTTASGSQKYLEFKCANAAQATSKSNPTPPPATCTSAEVTTRWTTYRRAVANATDHAAFRARSGQPGTNNINSMIFTILLGGNATGADAPDFRLFQRIANDSRADQFNGSSPVYTAYTLPTAFASQPQGRLVFSSDKNNLRRAFLEISSQILRLSQ